RDIPQQPCCGYFLHGGTRVVGLIDFGLSLFAMILIGSEIYQRIDQLVALKQEGDLSYGGFNAALCGLTDAEVEEFEKGCPPDREDPGLTIQNQAFNKDFEILPENLDIDKSSILGSGAFGCVYRGKLNTETGSKSVAVKTVNPSADVAYFKTLLAELKVMTFLQQNDNVVNLIGACTAGIKNKELYVVVEFCPFGNLHDYLKARRGLFVNFVKDGDIRSDCTGKFIYSNVHSGNTVTTVDIFKWVYETSKGLEFLEEKKVVHGDIAARNILLGFGKMAKISDFGLAKKLYQYTTIKKEALPFPGFNWDHEFVHKIRDGLRMKQPKNATNEMQVLYDLMLKCWQPEPLDRPTFQEIRQALEEILNKTSSPVAHLTPPLANSPIKKLTS
ncbi:Vascular endothelial growth factor receptor 3, partial [Orchesella cincta]